MYEIVMTADALQVYQRAAPPLLRKLNRCFDHLSCNPHAHPNIKRLAGVLRGRSRYRAGDWRVVYRINEKQRQVIVLLIAHRSNVYD